MSNYRQGDILWRRGTIGAQREQSSHAVVILSVNDEELLNGERFYTCALISNRSNGRPGEIQIQDAEGGTAFINLSQIMITGERTFCSLDEATGPKIGELSGVELAKMKSSLDALISAEKAHFGKVVYSATPAHDGARGKPNRPYVLVGSMGKGTGVFFAVPVGSSPGASRSGTAIQDLDSAGLVRDAGEASYLRLAWSGTINAKTSSHPAGKLSENDSKSLYQQFLVLKKQIIDGVVKMKPALGNTQQNASPKTFPAGLALPRNEVQRSQTPYHANGVGGRV
jgi:hypothetical protein